MQHGGFYDEKQQMSRMSVNTYYLDTIYFKAQRAFIRRSNPGSCLMTVFGVKDKLSV